MVLENEEQEGGKKSCELVTAYVPSDKKENNRVGRGVVKGQERGKEIHRCSDRIRRYGLAGWRWRTLTER